MTSSVSCWPLRLVVLAYSLALMPAQLQAQNPTQAKTLPLPAGNENASPSLNLQQALNKTQANNSLLLQYPYQQLQAQALAEQASIKPLPVLSLEAENLLGSGEYQSLDSAEFTLTLSQNIELGGKADKRLALAQASGQYEDAEYALTRLDVLAETSRRYYRLLKSQALQELLEQRLQQETQALNTLRRRARAGVVTSADVAKLDLRQAQTRAWKKRLTTRYGLNKLRLASMWQAEATFASVAGDLQTLPSIPSREQVLVALNNSPKILQQQALLRLADARVANAQVMASSDLSIAVGIRQMQATSDQAFTLSFSMPLAFSNPNAGRIKAAQAQQKLSQLQQQQQQQQLRLQLLEFQLQIQLYADDITTIDEELLPRAQSLLKKTQAGFNKGRYSVLQWTDAEAELFAVQQQRLELSHNIYLYLLEIERITGQPLSHKAANQPAPPQGHITDSLSSGEAS